jgi:AcrR family transcriptional regulator
VNARGDRTRRRLLATAREIIERDGFGALTITSVAASAGVTRRAVYLHFESRGALLAELFDHVAGEEDLAGSLQRVWDAPDSTGVLEAWAAHLADYHVRLMPLSRAVRDAARLDDAAAAHLHRVEQAQRATCRRIVRRLMDDGALAPTWTPSTATDMVWALISDDLIAALLDGRRWSRPKLQQHLAELFTRAFVR